MLSRDKEIKNGKGQTQCVELAAGAKMLNFTSVHTCRGEKKRVLNLSLSIKKKSNS